MTTDHSQDGPNAGPADHLVAGREIATSLGLPDNEMLLAASLGRNDAGNRQVLVLGGLTVTLVAADNAAEREELPRSQIRSVDAVAGTGLVLRLGLGRQTVHRLGDREAEQFRDLIIEMPITPFNNGGGHVIPEQDWRRDRIARLVGQVVVRAAEAEHMLGVMASSWSGQLDFQAFGQSGKPLSAALDRLGESNRVAADMAERYSAWSDLRNQLVHSVRPNLRDGRPDSKTFRPVRVKQGDPLPEHLYLIEDQDERQIVDVWYAFNWLYHDAFRAWVQVATGVDPSELPPSNSVVGNRRLPDRNAATDP